MFLEGTVPRDLRHRMPGVDILVLSKDPSDITLDSPIENQCPIQAWWTRHLQSQDGEAGRGRRSQIWGQFGLPSEILFNTFPPKYQPVPQ